MNIFIVLTLLPLCFDSIFADHCNKLLRELADKQKNFIRCSTVHAVPVALCLGCYNEHNEMDLAYKNLRDVENCTKEYFDNDRINIVATTNSILNGLWMKAYCDNCFVNNIYEIFSNKSGDLDLCFTQHSGTQCINCLDGYEDLNKFYINLDQKNNGQICYDLQDTMNRTRSKWSRDFHCCRRQFQMTNFLIVSGFCFVLPILFYCSTFLYTKRRDIRHGILTAADLETNTASTSTTTADTPPITTSAPIPPKRISISDNDMASSSSGNSIKKKKLKNAALLNVDTSDESE